MIVWQQSCQVPVANYLLPITRMLKGVHKYSFSQREKIASHIASQTNLLSLLHVVPLWFLWNRNFRITQFEFFNFSTFFSLPIQDRSRLANLPSDLQVDKLVLPLFDCFKAFPRPDHIFLLKTLASTTEPYPCSPTNSISFSSLSPGSNFLF